MSVPAATASAPAAAPTPDARRGAVLGSLPVGLVLAMALLAAWGGLVIPGWRWQMNADGVSYLSVAAKYLAGELGAAVNGYWSPLYCWLLAAVMAAGVEPLLATKILAVVIGEAILVIVWWLAANLGVARDGRLLVSLTLCPILVYFGMTVTTPDLLMAGAVLLYLAHLTSAANVASRRHRMASGALGGVAYLAKAYALQFVVVHLAVVSAFDVLRAGAARRRMLGAAIAGYAGLLLVAGPWIACLSAKYGYLTTGSVGRFSLAWNGPGFRIPMFVQGFLPPSDPSAVSVWDDGTALSFTPWNPLASPSDRQHFAHNLVRNANTIALIGQSFTPLLLPIVIAAAACTCAARRAREGRDGFVVLSAFVLFPAGYFLLHVQERFLSLSCVLLLVLGAWVVATVTRRLTHAARWRAVATAVLCLTFLVDWGWQSAPSAAPGGSATSAVDTARRLFGRWSVLRGWDSQRGIAELAATLRAHVPRGANVASANDWDRSLYLSYHLGARFWGVPAPGASPEQIRTELRQHGIEYFWLWGDPRRFPVVAGWQRIRAPGLDYLPLYRVPHDVAGDSGRERVPPDAAHD